MPKLHWDKKVVMSTVISSLILGSVTVTNMQLYILQITAVNTYSLDKISANTFKIKIHESHKFNLYKYRIKYSIPRKSFRQYTNFRLYSMTYELLNTQVTVQ